MASWSVGERGEVGYRREGRERWAIGERGGREGWAIGERGGRGGL